VRKRIQIFPHIKSSDLLPAEPVLYSPVEVGQPQDISKTMTNKDGDDGSNQKLEHVIELLKFVLSLDDEEIIKSTVESVIEILQEISE
jgi:hypothetical protein